MARRSSLAAALVLAVVALLAPAEAKGSKGVRRNSALHGKPRKKGRRPPPRKKKRREYDYDDEDDDDDDFGGGSRQMTYYKPRRKPTGPSVLQRAQAMAKEASARGLEMSKVAASRAKDLAAEAAVKGQEASRLAKAYYSSEYEKFLLTATWPSDQRVSPQLAKRLVESVARFPARPHALPDDDPYRVTLRKLWKKMIERDWRTTQKALYLLHALSRSTPTKNARALSRTLKSMVGDADPKTGRKYFSRRELVALRGDDGAERGAVVDAYAGFVLRRALLFAGKFEDVAAPKKKKKPAAVEECPADVINEATLKRAQNALLVTEHALTFLRAALDDPDPRRAHLVVVSCVELVVADLVDGRGARRRGALAAALAAGAPATTPPPPRSPSTRPSSRAPRRRPASLKTLRFFDLRVAATIGDTDVDAAIDAALAARRRRAAAADAAAAASAARPRPRTTRTTRRTTRTTTTTRRTTTTTRRGRGVESPSNHAIDAWPRTRTEPRHATPAQDDEDDDDDDEDDEDDED